METNVSTKRKLEVDTILDSTSNKRESGDCPTDQNGNASMSTMSVNGEGINGFETTLIGDISPIISQEDCVLESPKNATTKAVTLLAKVDARKLVEYVNIVPRTGDGTKLVTGLHRCIGRQGSSIGQNNVFVTALVEGGQAARNVAMGDILGYAQTFGTLLSTSLKNVTVSKIKMDADFYLYPHLTTVVEATVESLNGENEKNYPIRFKSTNKSLQVIGDRYTIQKGNSARVRIKNVSGQIIALKSGDTLGIAESLLSKEYIEEIQLSNDESIEIIEEIDESLQLPLGINYDYVFLEIETIKASNNDRKEITQIGCYTSLSKDQEKKFFKVIEPRELNNYLDNFTIAGDLLRFLHLQRNEKGQFEFRKQFEIVKEGVEVPKCTTEKEALQALATYLSSFSTDCILVSICKETVKLVVERMKLYQLDLNFLKGFCDWDSILEKALDNDIAVGSVREFDEWYSERVNDDVSSNVHAEKVASMHQEAVNHIFEMISPSSSPSAEILLQASSSIRTLHADISALKPGGLDPQTPPAFLELSNSLRPNMPTTITMHTLETIDIISDEEDPLPQASERPDTPPEGPEVRGQGPTPEQPPPPGVGRNRNMCPDCHTLLKAMDGQRSCVCSQILIGHKLSVNKDDPRAMVFTTATGSRLAEVAYIRGAVNRQPTDGMLPTTLLDSMAEVARQTETALSPNTSDTESGPSDHVESVDDSSEGESMGEQFRSQMKEQKGKAAQKTSTPLENTEEEREEEMEEEETEESKREKWRQKRREVEEKKRREREERDRRLDLEKGGAGPGTGQEATDERRDNSCKNDFFRSGWHICNVPIDIGHNLNDVSQASSSRASSTAIPESSSKYQLNFPIQNVESEGSLEVSHLPSNSATEGNESTQSPDDLAEGNYDVAPPSAPQSKPIISFQSNPPVLQSNIIQSSSAAPTLAPSQSNSCCQICERIFASSNALKNHLLTSGKHNNLVKQRLQALSKSRARPEEEGVLWWDLKNRISSLSSPFAQKQMHRVIEDLAMLALYFDKRGIEIVDYIEKLIFDPTAPYMAPARLLRFLTLLCKRSLFYQDLVKYRIVASFVHAFRNTSDNFLLLEGSLLRLEWETFCAFEVKTLQELDSEMMKICPLWMSELSGRRPFM